MLTILSTLAIKMKAEFDYSHESFAAIEYTWTDDNGDTHTSNLAEEATDPNQILAMLTEVYSNDNIPGTTWVDGGEEDTSGNTGTVTYYRDGENSFPNMGADVPNPESGMTCVLVKVKRGWTINNRETNPLNWIRSCVESMQVVTSRQRIDGAEPGYCFNIETPCNLFYWMTKGKRRKMADKITKNAFEIYSPGDDASSAINTVKANDIMEAGEAYEVVHDCGGGMIFNGPHYFGIHGLNGTVAEQHNYCMFIPDARFYYWNQRDVNGPFTWYNKEHRPLLFSYQIKLTATLEPNEDEDWWNSHVTWSSNYKRLTQSTVAGEFYLYRVLADGSYQAIQASEMTAVYPDSTQVSVNDEGLTVIKSNAVYPQVLVAEKEYATTSHTVRYIISGHPLNSEFTLSTSNEDEVIIPSHASTEQLAIEGQWRSTHAFKTHSNAYSNQITVLSNTEGLKPLIQQYVADGDVFTLYRTPSNDSETHVEVGFLTITSKTLSADEESYNYTGTITYTNTATPSQVVTMTSGTLKASEIVFSTTESKKPIFTDNFIEDVANAVPSYEYQLIQTESASGTIVFSNTLTFTPHRSNVAVELCTYTQEEVESDTDHHLKPNTVVAHLTAKRSTEIRRYELQCTWDNGDSWTEVARLSRIPGTTNYSLTTLAEDGSLSYQPANSTITMDAASKAVDVTVPYIPYAIGGSEAPSFCVNIVTATEDVYTDNTWGTTHALGVSMPWVTALNTWAWHAIPESGNPHDISMRNLYDPHYPVSNTDWNGGTYNVWRTIPTGETLIVNQSVLPTDEADAQSTHEVDPTTFASTHRDNFHYTVSSGTTSIPVSYRVRHYALVASKERSAEAAYVLTEDKINLTVDATINTGVEDAVENDPDTTTLYFNLQGLYVGNDPTQLPSGIYIERSAKGAHKIRL